MGVGCSPSEIVQTKNFRAGVNSRTKPKLRFLRFVHEKKLVEPKSFGFGRALGLFGWSDAVWEVRCVCVEDVGGGGVLDTERMLR